VFLTNQSTLKTDIFIGDSAQATALLGTQNRNLKAIQERFAVRIKSRGDKLVIEGSEEEIHQVVKLFSKLKDLVKDQHVPDITEVEYLADQILQNRSVKGALKGVIGYTHWGEPIRPKTSGQARYIQTISDHEVVFAIGSSGSGKTYLAVAMAVQYLNQGNVQRIILTRPAVEAGEELGFLPGDIEQKVDPYLRPLYDSLKDMIPEVKLSTYIEHGRIEIAPLAYMRGRTLNNSFVILDEAQNTTYLQMKMFMTRLGLNSRAVITGDVSQSDLRKGARSGLSDIEQIFKDIKEIGFAQLSREDVVRSVLQKKVVNAYEEFEAT